MELVQSWIRRDLPLGDFYSFFFRSRHFFVRQLETTEQLLACFSNAQCTSFIPIEKSSRVQKNYHVARTVFST